MPNIFKLCCVKENKLLTNLKMEQVNGQVVPVTCPFMGDSVDSDKSGKPNLRVKVPQPIKLKYLLHPTESYDTLHTRQQQTKGFITKCSEQVCLSSVFDIPNPDDQPRTVDQTYSEAESFFQQYYTSIRRENSDAYKNRMEQVKKELHETGTYQLKNSELVFGTKLAWRNATRCIGRIQWKKLQVFDCREVTTARGMFEALCNHIKYATNKGNIRSAITVFPQRTDGKHDYRIWNNQLLSYAGYKQPDGSFIGDSYKAELTEVCLKLGWKPKFTPWDILPLVLSADGKEPEFFDIPPEIVLEVQMEHPEYDWFKDLGMKWYVLPAVSNMRMDCGGLQFTGTAFSGWYMSTEIGCRNLCDASRYNMVEIVAAKMGLDTNSYVSLWKDKALVEVNIAVLHSFQKNNVTLVDHHSASEQFMKHLDNEHKLRGGCPSDWIWIVPPMSASITPVYHQEMALYYIRPSYDYQVPAWKTYQWNKTSVDKPNRKFHFKQIARAVKFTSKLFSRALSRRIKATILYASETGKSEGYAKELGSIFGHVFNVQVHCMSDYDMFSIEHETLLIIVTSTFGNGEPPANGVEFADHLFQLLYHEGEFADKSSHDTSGSHKLLTPKTLMRTNSTMTPIMEYKRQLSRLESTKSSIAAASSIEHIGPLSNVMFAVFALGSSAYPKFCNFGNTIDKILYELGGERILEIGCGDELYNQEQTFREWSSNIFHVACETFCLEESDMINDARKAIANIQLTSDTVRFSKVTKSVPLKIAVESVFKKHVISCKIIENKNLCAITDDKATIFIDMASNIDIKYDPGDHLGVMAVNRTEIVDVVLEKCKDIDQNDKHVQLQILKETLTITGTVKSWENHERMPPVSVRDIFSRFLDLTTPPSTRVLKYLAEACDDNVDRQKIIQLIEDSDKYDDWRYFYWPNLAEVLQMYPSCKPAASLLAALLPPLQPRFYSISSSYLAHPNRIQLTVSVITYKTQNGKGPTHYGVCSTYLQNLKPNDELMGFIRRAPSFHMPTDITRPLILVGPGSGISPFRGFWEQRRWQLKHLSPTMGDPGPIWLFFGSRNKSMDLYKEEKQKAVEDGVLSKVFLALSREEGVQKKHVQALIDDNGSGIARMLVEEKGHFYVCGDCKMAEDVQQTLKGVIKKYAKMTDEEVEQFILTLMDENRYHEDIFGITLRTAEVNSASRETAKRTRLSSSQSQG